MSGDETTHHYPWHRVRGDYVRAAVGLVLCLSLLAVAAGTFWPFIIIAAPTVAFAVFGIRTWLRHTTALTVTDTGISGRPAGAVAVPWHSFSLPWRDMNRIKLSYYATRRDKSDGWMQMTIATPGSKWSGDSNLEGFDRIARLAFDAAVRNRLEISDTTFSNFHAMGIVDANSATDEDLGWGDPATWRDTPAQ